MTALPAHVAADLRKDSKATRPQPNNRDLFGEEPTAPEQKAKPHAVPVPVPTVPAMPIEPALPTQAKAQKSHADCIVEFRQAIAAAGITPPSDITADGQIHRFSANGKRSNLSGWYSLHLDGTPAGTFGNWGSGTSTDWCSRNASDMAPGELAAMQDWMAETSRKRAIEKAAEQCRVRDVVATRWDKATPATEHPYLTRKGIKPHGAKVEGDLLLIPIRDTDGILHSLQTITNNGQKMFVKNGRKQGNFASIGGCPDIDLPDATLIICEGFATGASLYECTGYPVAVAFDAGNLLPVARALRGKYPTVNIILAADNDCEAVPNVGIDSAKKAAEKIGAKVAHPIGLNDNQSKKIDFNDLHLWHGVDAVVSRFEDDNMVSHILAVDGSIDSTAVVMKGTDGAPFGSDTQLAESFAKKYVGQFRWTNGLGWLVNSGSHWENDVRLLRSGAAKAVCAAVSNQLGSESKKTKLFSKGTRDALLSLAQGEPGINTGIEQWDAYPMLLNTPGDVYDLTTGEIVPRDGLLFTQITDIAPTSMPTPVWDKFISEVFAGDVETIEFIQRMGGYCLTGSTREQKLFFLYGEGANGKSVFLEVLRAIGGKYSHNLPSEALMTSKHEQHSTVFVSLHGKRVAISSEIESSAHWAESKIKSLTGDATISGRRLYQEQFTFNITHKHIIAGNSKPRLKGDDFAMVRRMVLIPFTQKFEGIKKDVHLPEKLKSEYPGILKWFIEGARKWANDGLRIPGAVSKSTAEYMAQQNDIQLWIDECCTVGNGLQAGSTAAYQSYSAFKSRNGEHAGSGKAFSERLEKLFPKEKTRTGAVFKGLCLDPSAQHENEYERKSRGF